MHLGNYLGAFRQFTELQKDYEAFFMIADLHAMTKIHDAKLLKKMVHDTKRAFLAFGLDPRRSTLFVQSEIPQHTQLAWMFATLMPVSELTRMTQFKDKTVTTDAFKTPENKWEKIEHIVGDHIKKQLSGANTGLLTYPLLMAADILLYKAEAVPVGEDQAQHLELTRVIARKFNNTYGTSLPEPKTMLSAQSARVMSLADPHKKMSASLGSKHYVSIFESEKNIREKFQKAVTDSGNSIKYNLDEKPGVSNLLDIYTALTGEVIDEAQKYFRGKSYADLKREVAKVVLKEIKPIQKRYRTLKARQVDKAFEAGREKAEEEAEAHMKKIRKQVGL